MIDNWLLARRVRNARPDRFGWVELPGLCTLAFTPGVPVRVSFKDATVPRDRAARFILRLKAITIADRAAFEPDLWELYQTGIDGDLHYHGTVENIIAAGQIEDPTFAGAVPATCPREVWPLIHLNYMKIYDVDGTLEAEVGGAAIWDFEHGCCFIFSEDGTLDDMRITW